MRRHGLRRSLVAVLIACGLAFGVSASSDTSPAASSVRPTVAAVPARCAGSPSSVLTLGLAGSVKLLSQTAIPVCATGGLTVSFDSTAAGCAAQGPCGYAGTDSWRPSAGGVLELVAYRQAHRRRYAAMLLLGQDDPVVAAVQHTGPAGVTSSCRDSDRAFSGFLSSEVRQDRLTVDLDGGQPPLLGTRCAGPLNVDLGAALPGSQLALWAALHGRATVDLSGTRGFRSRDFTGDVSSSLVLRLGRPRTSPVNAPLPGPRGPLTRSVDDFYRLQSLRGGLTVGLRASSDPTVCGALDACGVAGAIAIAARSAPRSNILLDATGPAKRPYQDFLAALGHGRGDPRGIDVGGGGQLSVHGTVTAQLTTPTICRDATRLFSAEVLLQASAGRLRVSLSPAGSQANDPLRTRCPGPAVGSDQLAAATVPLSTLRHRTFTVALHGARRQAGPYQLTAESTIRLTLRRTRQTTQTFRVPVAPR